MQHRLIYSLVTIAFLFVEARSVTAAQQPLLDRIYQMTTDGADSTAWAEVAASLEPGDPWLEFAQAILLQEGQDYEAAADAMKRVREQFRGKDELGELLAVSQLSALFSKMRDRSRCKPYAQECMELSGETHPLVRGHCMLNYAIERRHNNDFDSAFYLMRGAKVLFDNHELSYHKALVLMNFGSAFHYLDQLDSAAHYYLECIRILEKENEQSQLAKAYNNLSILYQSLRDYQQSKHYLISSIKIRQDLDDKQGIAACQTTLGNIYLAEAKWDSASHAFALAEELFQSVADQAGMLWSYNNIANASYYGGDYQKAHQFFKRAYAKAVELNDSIEMSRIASNMGWSFLSLGKKDSARMQFEAGMAIAEKLPNLETKKVAYTGMADYFIEVGDYKQALEYSSKARDISDQIVNEKRTRQLAEMQTKYETEKKENEIIRLDRENAKAELKISQQRNWIIGIVLGSLIFLVSAGLIYLQRKRKIEAQLAQKELEFRKQLLDATVLGEEQERQRIAKDMHDGLVQTLAVIKMGLQSVGRKLSLDKEVKEAFEERVKMVDEAVEEARNLSHQMMPRALMETGLVSAMEDMLAKALRHTEIGYEFEPLGLKNDRFSQRVEVGLYRIAQEMVNNIIKHSGATEASIQLIKTKDYLVLHIEDNGRGFAMGDRTRQNGIGLNNIFSRASSVNGEVSFEPGEPKGTVANVRVPLNS